MALILNIETATDSCSVCLANNGIVLDYIEKNGDYSHAENLTMFISELMNRNNIAIEKLDAIAVSMGPGSYTGLRIGVSTAKGLCYGLNKPLIAVNTLQHLAYSVSSASVEKSLPLLYCPMIDARRMEVYCAMYDGDNRELLPVSASIITADSFSDLLSRHNICFFGNGAEKCKSLLSYSPNARFISDVVLSSTSMAALANNAFNHNNFENLRYFEPYYLKDFLINKKQVGN